MSNVAKLSPRAFLLSEVQRDTLTGVFCEAGQSISVLCVALRVAEQHQSGLPWCVDLADAIEVARDVLASAHNDLDAVLEEIAHAAGEPYGSQASG